MWLQHEIHKNSIVIKYVTNTPSLVYFFLQNHSYRVGTWRMIMKSFLNKITDRAKLQKAAAVSAEQEHQEVSGEVDHLWMKEDLDAEKPMLEKDPRIDTGILRNRIADKLAKMNNY